MPEPFRTIIPVKKAPFTIHHGSGIVSMGSCFSQNIGQLFEQSKFTIDLNPFGQQYNPISILDGINRLIDRDLYTSSDLVFDSGFYHSFDHHGSFSGRTEHAVLEVINRRISQSHIELKMATHLFLTFGTAHCFRHTATDKIVSNCHKIPNNQFKIEMLSGQAIAEGYTSIIEKLNSFNPGLQLIFTVSPVRYFAFGHFENTLSKSQLFSAIAAIIEKFENAIYFPAYELVMDDLRDYRFYKEDMIHPTDQAINYVWERLAKMFFTQDTQDLIVAVEKINNALNHRPRQAESDQHKKFLKKLLDDVDQLESKYQLDFALEKNQIMASLTA